MCVSVCLVCEFQTSWYFYISTQYTISIFNSRIYQMLLHYVYMFNFLAHGWVPDSRTNPMIQISCKGLLMGGCRWHQLANVWFCRAVRSSGRINTHYNMMSIILIHEYQYYGYFMQMKARFESNHASLCIVTTLSWIQESQPLPLPLKLLNGDFE